MRQSLDRLSRVADRLEAALIPVSLLAAVVLPAVGIARSLWLDEANSALIAADGLGQVAERLRLENNFPAYYYLLAVWIRLFGLAELTLRLPSLGFHLLTGAAVYGLAGSLFPERAGARYAAFLYFVSTQAVQLAQTVRMYTLLGLLCAVASLLLARVVRRGTRLDTALYAATSSLGFLTHAWFAFVAVAHVVYALLLGSRPALRRIAIGLGVACVPFAVLWLPAFLGQLGNGATSWMSRIGPSVLVAILARYWGGVTGAAALLAACVLAAAYRPREARELLAGGESRLLLVLAAASLGSAAVVSFVRPIYSPDRYTVIALPALCALLGAYLARVAPAPLRVALVCWLLVVAGAAQARRAEQSSLFSDRETATRLVQRSRPGDVLLFTSLSRAGVDYYLRRLAAADRFGEISFPAEVAEHLGWREVRVSHLDVSSLDREAEASARRAASLLEGPEATAWVFWGRDLMVANLLRRRLDQSLSLCGSFDLGGSYYTSVLAYRRACGEAPKL